MAKRNIDYRIAPMKDDILKLIDKVDDLEQMIFNCDAKRRDEYKLINDRITEAFDIIKMIERLLIFMGLQKQQLYILPSIWQTIWENLM